MSDSPKRTDAIEPISLGELPAIRSFVSLWNYYLLVFRCVAKETFKFFGWNRRTMLVPILFVVGVVVAMATLRGELVLDQILTTMAFGLAPVGLLAIVVVAVNFIRAPHLIHQEVVKEANVLMGKTSQLLAWFQPQLAIEFDPNDKNCVQRNVHVFRRPGETRPELSTMFRVRVRNKSAIQVNTVVVYVDYAWNDQDFGSLPLRTMHDETLSWGTLLGARDKRYFDVVIRRETPTPDRSNPIAIRHVKVQTVRDDMSASEEHRIKIVATCHLGQPAEAEFWVYVNEHDRLCFEPAE